jgi:hypothetical protein
MRGKPISDKRLAEIAAIPDEAIDTSDIREGTKADFERARVVQPDEPPQFQPFYIAFATQGMGLMAHKVVEEADDYWVVDRVQASRMTTRWPRLLGPRMKLPRTTPCLRFDTADAATAAVTAFDAAQSRNISLYLEHARKLELCEEALREAARAVVSLDVKS